MTKQEIEESFNKLMEAYNEFKTMVRQEDKILYERWKAGGFLVDDDILSMYPNALEVFNILSEKAQDEDEDSEEEDTDRLCESCGSKKPEGQSCGCFDNHCQ